MLSTLRGSTSTLSRFPNTTWSTTPPNRSASSRASRSASATSASGSPRGLEEAAGDRAVQLTRRQLELLGAEQAGSHARGRRDDHGGHVVGQQRRLGRDPVDQAVGARVVLDLLEQLLEPLAAEDAVLRAGLHEPVGEEARRPSRAPAAPSSGADPCAPRRRSGATSRPSPARGVRVRPRSAPGARRSRTSASPFPDRARPGARLRSLRRGSRRSRGRRPGAPRAARVRPRGRRAACSA